MATGSRDTPSQLFLVHVLFTLGGRSPGRTNLVFGIFDSIDHAQFFDAERHGPSSTAILHCIVARFSRTFIGTLQNIIFIYIIYIYIYVADYGVETL
jgi:hypothetical protein